MLGILSQLESQRRADYNLLRDNLGTLATLTDSELRRTQRGIAALASYAQNTRPVLLIPENTEPLDERNFQ